MENYSLIDEELIEKAGIFKKRGIVAQASDLAILLGARTYEVTIREGQKMLVTSSTNYFTSKSVGKNFLCVGQDDVYQEKASNKNIGARIMTRFQYLDSINVTGAVEENSDGIITYEYGYYPQSACHIIMQEVLEKKYENNNLAKIGQTYHFAAPNDNVEVYTLDDRKYIRIKACLCSQNEKNRLSNGQTYKNGDSVWIEVEPIEWLIDRAFGIIVSKRVLISGIPFKTNNRSTNIYDDINKYLSIVLDKDIDISLSRTVIDKLGNIIRPSQNEEIVTKVNQENSQNIFDHYLKKAPKEEKENRIYTRYGFIMNDNIYERNPVIGRDKEIHELEKMLVIPKKGVILLGEAGVGKTSVVEGLVYRMQKGNTCSYLKNKKILSTSISSLLAGTKYRGEFEDKVTKLCEELSRDGNTILFLDEIQTSFQTGNTESNGIDIANILKPYISNRNMKVIGCTTTSEFDLFNSDKAFRRRFNILPVNELEDDIVIEILMDYIMNNEFNIKINASKEELISLCNLIIKISKRKQKYTYEKGNNPDAAINILMYCFAYLTVADIQEANINDFIEGIVDNPNISLNQFETDAYLNTTSKEHPNIKCIKLVK